MSLHRDSAQLAEGDPNVSELCARGLISIEGARITYSLSQSRSYQWTDPEEWVRARTIAFLIIEKGYPANRLKTEARVPRRTPSDLADVVVFEDDACRSPYIVVENKADGQNQTDRDQAIEQAFGNANSLRSPFALYDEGSVSTAFDVPAAGTGEGERRMVADLHRPQPAQTVPLWGQSAQESTGRWASPTHQDLCRGSEHGAIRKAIWGPAGATGKISCRDPSKAGPASPAGGRMGTTG